MQGVPAAAPREAPAPARRLTLPAARAAPHAHTDRQTRDTEKESASSEDARGDWALLAHKPLHTNGEQVCVCVCVCGVLGQERLLCLVLLLLLLVHLKLK